jgi:hypothetical protein
MNGYSSTCQQLFITAGLAQLFVGCLMGDRQQLSHSSASRSFKAPFYILLSSPLLKANNFGEIWLLQPGLHQTQSHTNRSLLGV